jgi:catechol 2,3-dioxygenase-like lactoylglutathione lyase family enzyme
MIEMLGFSVRYIVDDIDAAITFYTKYLGFDVVMHPNDFFVILSRDGLRLMLNTPSGPGGGSHPAPDGSLPKPGGSNRIQIRVGNLAKEVASLREAGIHFGTDIITGVGAKQILLQDPSGNLIELHELLPRAQQSG